MFERAQGVVVILSPACLVPVDHPYQHGHLGKVCLGVACATHGTMKWIACGGFRRTTGLLVAFTGMIRCVLPCVCCYRKLPVRLMRCPHGVDLVVHVQGNVIIRVVAKPLNVDVESLLELVKALDDRRVSWLLLRCCHSVVPFSTICAGSSCAGHLR